MNVDYVTGFLPSKNVNKLKQRTKECQSMHRRTNLFKILSLNVLPSNAFGFLCIIGSCALLDRLDLSRIENQKKAEGCCSGQPNHKQSLHPNKDLKYIICSYFELDQKYDGLGCGTEYLHLEKLNVHFYEYIGGQFIEIESKIEMENENENDSNNDASSNEIKAYGNADAIAANNHVTLPDSMADFLLPRLVTAITPRMISTRSTNNSNYNSRNSNNSSNRPNLNTTSDNIYQYVDSESSCGCNVHVKNGVV